MPGFFVEYFASFIAASVASEPLWQKKNWAFFIVGTIKITTFSFVDLKITKILAQNGGENFFSSLIKFHGEFIILLDHGILQPEWKTKDQRSKIKMGFRLQFQNQKQFGTWDLGFGACWGF